MRRTFVLPGVLAALVWGFAGCATSPLATCPTAFQVTDPAGRLDLYHRFRVQEGPWSYRVQGRDVTGWSLPSYYEDNGDTLAARWARRGLELDSWTWAMAAALEGYLVFESSDPRGEGHATWAVGLAPVALATWGLDWLFGNYFLSPSVTHFNRALAKRLGLSGPAAGPRDR